MLSALLASSAMTSLNNNLTTEAQMSSGLLLHTEVKVGDARARAPDLPDSGDMGD